MSRSVSLWTCSLSASAALLIAMNGGAQAASARDIIDGYGMLGRWATDCSSPPSPNNFHTVYAAVDKGQVKRTYYNSPDKIYNEYTIVAAKVRDDDALWYEQYDYTRNDVQRHMIVIIDRVDDRYHVLFSKPVKGDALVEGGEFKKGNDAGTSSPWQQRCR